LLADDLIEDALLLLGVDGSMLASGLPNDGSDFTAEEGAGDADSAGLLASGRLIPKFGVLVEIGKLGEIES